MKRLSIAVSIVALAALLFPAPLGAAPRGLTCSLKGRASFTPGLKVAPANGSYTFTGKLAGCRSTDSSLKWAKISAKGRGSTGCSGGTTNGVATLEWNNGKLTTVKFETVALTAGVGVHAVVTRSTAKGIKKGDHALAALHFDADAADCNTAGGVKSATFEGEIAGGSPA